MNSTIHNENNYLKRKYYHNSIDTKKFIEWVIHTNFEVKIIMSSIKIQHKQPIIKLQKLINLITIDVKQIS